MGGVTGIAALLKSNVGNGIGDAGATFDANLRDAAERVSVFGVNQFGEPPHATIFQLILEQLQDPTIIMLMAAAATSIGLGVGLEEERTTMGYLDGIAILVAVIGEGRGRARSGARGGATLPAAGQPPPYEGVCSSGARAHSCYAPPPPSLPSCPPSAVVTSTGAWNNYSKDAQFRGLEKASKITDVKVIRASTEQLILSTAIVVGDVVSLDTGDNVPADGVFISGSGLVIDEASVTGESEAMHKSEKKPWMRSGTKVRARPAMCLYPGRMAIGEEACHLYEGRGCVWTSRPWL